jgi:hypothetical protein
MTTLKRETLIEVLEECEWAIGGWAEIGTCPVCQHSDPEHEDGCKLKDVLDKLRQMKCYAIGD